MNYNCLQQSLQGFTFLFLGIHSNFSIYANGMTHSRTVYVWFTLQVALCAGREMRKQGGSNMEGEKLEEQTKIYKGVYIYKGLLFYFNF